MSTFSIKAKTLAITQASWETFQRMFARSLFLVLLTVLGVWALDTLVVSGMSNQFGVVARFPEIIPLFAAAAKLTFIEMCVFWIRFSTQPSGIDSRGALEYLLDPTGGDFSPMAVVAFYCVNSLMWGFRIGVLLYLTQ
jgi:hypothetical protein